MVGGSPHAEPLHDTFVLCIAEGCDMLGQAARPPRQHLVGAAIGSSRPSSQTRVTRHNHTLGNRAFCHADSQAMQANNKNPDDGTGFYFPAVATNKLTVAGPDGGQMYTATCASPPHACGIAVPQQ